MPLLRSTWIPAVLTLIMGIVLSYILFVGNKPERWYSAEHIKTGKVLFEHHCAECHGLQAQGLVKDWKLRLANGSYPPPPLNGSAHAWHHSLPLLLQILQQGGALYDGKMPGFKEQLSEAEQLAVIAWFQSLWSDDIYHQWATDRKLPAIPFALVTTVDKGVNSDAAD